MQGINMNRTRAITVVFVLLCFLSGMVVLAAAGPDKKNGKTEENETQKIIWHKYDDGLKLAKAENKHVFIDFSTSWCTWCKKMDRETFAQPEIIKIMSDHFIAVKVDGDSRKMLDIDGYQISEKNLTKNEFGVTGYPAFWFLKADGTKLAQIRGYKPAKYMMEAFTFVKDRKYDTTSNKTKEN